MWRHPLRFVRRPDGHQGGLSARVTGVASMTAAQPSSMASAASLAVPNPLRFIPRRAELQPEDIPTLPDNSDGSNARAGLVAFETVATLTVPAWRARQTSRTSCRMLDAQEVHPETQEEQQMRRIKQAVAVVLMLGTSMAGVAVMASPADAALKPCYPNCPW